MVLSTAAGMSPCAGVKGREQKIAPPGEGARPRIFLESPKAVAEVEFERATGLQALGEQGSRAGLGRV